MPIFMQLSNNNSAIARVGAAPPSGIAKTSYRSGSNIKEESASKNVQNAMLI